MLFSCKNNSEETPETHLTTSQIETTPNLFTPYPLFSITKKNLAKRFDTSFYQLGSGITFVTETEKGYSFGYFDLEKSILAESLFLDDKFDEDSFALYNQNDFFSLFVVNDKIHFASLTEGSTEELYKSNISIKNPTLYNSIKIIYENDDYVLLSPIDLSEQYVLAEKNKLDNFDKILCADEKSKQIFYATKAENGFSGFASFKYGENKTHTSTGLNFDKYIYLGDCKFLFYNLENNLQIFTYYDLLTEKTSTYSCTLKDFYYSCSCDINGDYLVAYTDEDGTFNGGTIDIISMKDGSRIKRIKLAENQTNPNISITSNGKYIVFSSFTNVSGELCEEISFIKLY